MCRSHQSQHHSLSDSFLSENVLAPVCPPALPCQVEKMTATSTTEPKTERSTDLEVEREIQNALDKKRKKRRSVHVMKDVNIKHLRVDSKFTFYLLPSVSIYPYP